jgi:hypothetical protein
VRRPEEPAGAPALGLSEAHIPRNPKANGPEHMATVWRNAELLQVRSKGEPPEGGGVRGEVDGFSPASRRRLLYRVASLDRDAVPKPIFMTLTYPGEEWERFGGTKEQVKKHLDTFHHWLSYHYPTASVIWRLEFQKRGAPHYHLLVFGVPYIDCRLVAEEWYRVVGSGQESHLAAGTQVVACKSWKQATMYVAKYMAKPQSLSESGVPIHSRPGRVWGIWNRGGLVREAVDYELSPEEFFQFRRIVRGHAKSRGYDLRARASFSSFIGSAAGHRALAWVGASVLTRFEDGASSVKTDAGL